MAEAQFTIDGWDNQSRSTVSLKENEISGVGGLEYPYLSIPLKFTLRPREDGEMIDPYTLLWLKNELYIGVEGGKLGRKIGESVSKPIAEYSYPNSKPHPITIEIPLDFYRIKKIEEQRQGNIQFQLSGSALIAEHPPVPKANPNEVQKYPMNVERFNKGSYDISFTIPQSHWVKNVLPGLGYGKAELIEVPIPEKVIPADIFEQALKELGDSRQQFVEGHYDEAVSHCRKAIQVIADLSGIEKQTFRNKLSSFFSQYLPNLPQKKRKALEEIINQIWQLNSEAVHPRKQPETAIHFFDRVDTEATLQITITLLAYVGKLLKQEEMRL